MMQTTPTVITRDMGAIASLMCLDFEPRALRHDEAGRLIAEFEDRPQVKQALENYVLDRLLVSPRRLLGL
jgi:hypothetical protein